MIFVYLKKFGISAREEAGLSRAASRRCISVVIFGILINIFDSEASDTLPIMKVKRLIVVILMIRKVFNCCLLSNQN